MEYTAATAAAFAAGPRSNRVPRPSISTSTPSPPLPARSPLRPSARSISSLSSQNTLPPSLDSPLSPGTPQDTTLLHMRERHNSFPSLDTLIDPLLSSDHSMAVAVEKSLPARPDSPLSLNLEEVVTPNSPSPSPPPSAAVSVAQQPPMTKRQHALHELLSSERAYASDLALIRDIHIPLALGLTVPLTNMPISPPNSSGSSSRTLSTSSDSSTASLGPPMTPEDTKLIFGNVTEIALFADLFSDELEVALGSVVEGGQGEDTVGTLFLKIIPEMERPYKMYITRHPTALQHLQNLPQTPALTSYLAYTQTVASSLSHAWDLASLLIKPVQRLLKYPLLLGAIIDETPDAHPDKENLRLARSRMEEVARNVNEGRRRAEVVKDVLTSKTGKRPSTGVGVAASVNLSKMKSLRHGGVTAATMRVSQLAEGANGANAANGEGRSSEAALVEGMQAELKRLDVFAQQLAKNVVDWGKMMSNIMLALRTWALSFGKVIGLSAEQGSEAFDAFVEVVQRGLLPLTADLEAAINERLLKDLAHLLMTMTQPLKLLASMNEQEPYHYHLLTMPVSQKNRPPPSLLAASTNYLALRGQLAAELPTYLALLHKGVAVLVRRLAEVQTRFWRDVKERWAELWEMLRVEGEMNAGVGETTAVWCGRWSDVDEVVRKLGVVGPVSVVQAQVAAMVAARRAATLQAQAQNAHIQSQSQMQSQESFFGYGPSVGGIGGIGMAGPVYIPIIPSTPSSPSQPSTRDRNSRSSANSASAGTKSATVQSIIGALEPSLPSKEKDKPKDKDREKDRSKRHYQQDSVANIPQAMHTLTSLGPSSLALSSSSSVVANATAAALSTLSADYVVPSSSMYSVGGSSSMYSVSAPLPLGAYGSKDRDRESSRRSRGRGVSDASGVSGPGSTSGHVYPQRERSLRRPSSQDSLRSSMRRSREHETKALANSAAAPRRRTHGYVGMADDFAEYVDRQGQERQQERNYGGMPGPMPGGMSPPSYEGHEGYEGYVSNSSTVRGAPPSIPRTKSMPLSHVPLDRASVTTTNTTRRDANANANVHTAILPPSGGGYVVDGDQVYYQPPSTSAVVDQEWEEYQQYGQQYQQSQYQQQYQQQAEVQKPEVQRADSTRQSMKERGRRPSAGRSQTTPVTVPTMTNIMPSTTARPPSPGKRKSKERPPHVRKRSGSVKSITSFFTGGSSSIASNTNTTLSQDPQPLSASQRDSWVSKPAKYICQVVHPCKPPASVSYYSFPFFTLQEEDLYEVLQEAGHPSIHPKLPLYVDDGEDCLLLCRDGNGVVGWALASFLEPLSLGS